MLHSPTGELREGGSESPRAGGSPRSGQPRWENPGGRGCWGPLGGTQRTGGKPRSVVRGRPAVRTQEGTVAQERSDEGEINSTPLQRNSSLSPSRVAEDVLRAWAPPRRSPATSGPAASSWGALGAPSALTRAHSGVRTWRSPPTGWGAQHRAPPFPGKGARTQTPPGPQDRRKPRPRPPPHFFRTPLASRLLTRFPTVLHCFSPASPTFALPASPPVFFLLPPSAFPPPFPQFQLGASHLSPAFFCSLRQVQTVVPSLGICHLQPAATG